MKTIVMQDALEIAQKRIHVQEKRSCEKTCAPENAREICHEPANASESNGNKRKTTTTTTRKRKKGKFNLKYSQFHPYTWLVMKNRF